MLKSKRRSVLLSLTTLLVGSLLNEFAGATEPGVSKISLQPVEIKTEILTSVSVTDLIHFSRTSKIGRETVISATKMDGFRLDLRDAKLTESQFKSLFNETGMFQFVRKILLSDTSFRGEWIKFLPFENLGSEPDGTPRLQVTTASGAVYSYAGKHPEYLTELGHGWKDQSGLIWYETARDENGAELFLSHDQATHFCEDRGARLPSREEWELLAQAMGKGTLRGYNPNLLPDMMQWFWSSSLYGNDSAYYFNGLSRSFGNCYRTNYGLVRCVAP